MVNQSVNKANRERMKPDWVTHSAVFLGALLNGFSSSSHAQDYDVTVSSTDDFTQESIQPTFLYHQFQNTSSADVVISLPESIDTSAEDNLFHLIINQIDNDTHDLNLASLLSIDHSLFESYLESVDDDSGIAVVENTLATADLMATTPSQHVTTESSSHEVYWIIGGALVLGGITALILTDDSAADDPAAKHQLKIDSKLLFKNTQYQDNSIQTSLTGKNIIALHTADTNDLIKSASVFHIDDYSNGEVKITENNQSDLDGKYLLFVSSYKMNTLILTKNVKSPNVNSPTESYSLYKLDEEGDFTHIALSSGTNINASDIQLDYQGGLLLINKSSGALQKLTIEGNHYTISSFVPLKNFSKYVGNLKEDERKYDIFDTHLYACGLKEDKNVYGKPLCYSWNLNSSLDPEVHKFSSTCDGKYYEAYVDFVSGCDEAALLFSCTTISGTKYDTDSAILDLILFKVKGSKKIDNIYLDQQVLLSKQAVTISEDSSLSGESHLLMTLVSQIKMDPQTETVSESVQMYDLKIPASCDSIEMKSLASGNSKKGGLSNHYYEPIWYKPINAYINSHDQLTWLSANQKTQNTMYYYFNTINDFQNY